MREVDLLLFLVVFVHREVDDPGKFEPILVNQVQLFGEFGAREAGKRPKLLAIAGDEERGIAFLQPHGIAYSCRSFRAAGIGRRTCPLTAPSQQDAPEPRWSPRPRR